MGLGLMLYPAFSKSMHRSSSVLEKLGASWSLLRELGRDHASSRLHQSEIAQPVTTALQIALVDLLSSWNVVFDIIIGHSSGEIAAAYAAQTLSREEALAIAYYRGSVSKKAQNALGIPGGMAAVGLNDQDVQNRILGLGLSPDLSVACINSPSSTTVSGSIAAIKHFTAAIEAEGIFIRQLKVDAAYHSRHMEAVADAYLAEISTTQSCSNTPQARFYSTVTAQEKQSGFEPSYWVTNLVSPVRFSATLENLCRDICHTGHVDFVEMGPHSALQGPIRENIKAFPSHAPISWSYHASLMRSKDGVENILHLAAELQRNGPSLALPKTFITSPPSPMPGIPPYEWDHSRAFWHEPRLSRDYRYREHPPHELLGLRVLTSPDEEPSWRVLISQKCLPWLADHVIDGFAIFPATAFLAMVTEGIKQSSFCNKHGPEIHFQFRRITFMRVLPIPAIGKIEVILNFRKTTTSWVDFRIFSIHDGSWYAHCEGQIRMPHKSCTSSGDETRRLGTSANDQWVTTASLKLREAEIVERGAFYSILRSYGNDYGPNFALVHAAHASSDQAVARIVLPPVLTESSTHRLTPYSIHPTIFDAILQVAVFLLVRNLRVRGAMPTFYKQLSILPLAEVGRTEELIVVCKLKDESSRSATFDLSAYAVGENGLLQRVVECCNAELQATGDTQDSLTEGFQNTVFQMKWGIEPALITTQFLEAQELNPLLDVKLQEEKLYGLLEAANYFITNAIEELQQLNVIPIDSQTLACRHLEINVNREKAKRLRPSDKKLRLNLKELGVEGELLSRTGPALRSILTGDVDPLTLLLEDQLLYRVYQDDCTKKCNAHLAAYLAALTFKHASMRILEIGAGTGGSTIPLFEALSPDGQAFSRLYEYTDVSSGFFEQAKLGLKKWKDLITMRTLDIERDPIVQGFEEHSYDLIISSNVLHATHNLDDTLSNVHRLLKPSGALAFIELTRSNQFYDMTFGLLPGWWSGVQDGRHKSPLLSVDQWDTRLCKTSFTGIDFAAFDFPEPVRRAAFMVSRAKKPSIPNGFHVYPAKILNSLSPLHPGQRLLQPLVERLNDYGYQASQIFLDDREIESSFSYVILESHDKPLLANCTSEEFQYIKDLITSGLRIAWITLPGEDSITYDPGSGLIVGFSRTARSEYESIDLVTVDVKDAVVPNIDQVTFLVAEIISCPTNQLSIADPDEREYRILDGRLQIPRIVRSPHLDAIKSDQPESEHKVPFHSPEHSIELQVGNPGLLNTIQFAATNSYTPIGPDEVELDVHAFGVNFKDLWVALGQMKATDRLIGECAGIVANVGERFKHKYKVGDRVAALTATPYASRARANGHTIHRILGSSSFVMAASVPVAFCTAYYSLIEVAHLQHDQRVLVHAGSGALGQAAIQIARHIGAEIFTTTSNSIKRQLLIDLYEIPSDHIFSSRSTSFKDSILEMTGGEGVDVALNALSGELFHATWECVAELGTFVEVGKMEIRRNGQLDMEQFDKNVTFSSVDMILLARRRPQLIDKILGNVFSMLQEGILKPVSPITILPIGEAEQAFRMMQTRKHTGKVVLDAASDAHVHANMPSLRLDQNGSYIIVGGLGKLGRQLCGHLCTLGAGHVLLITTKEIDSKERNVLQERLRSNSTQVSILCCDVTTVKDITALAATVASSFPPLKGIINGPMVLQDKSLDEMTVEGFRSAIDPKYIGTRNLVEAFKNTELDFFILLSSLSGIIGLPGQANYAAGNAYQDHVAQGSSPSNWRKFISLDMPVLIDTHVISKEQQDKLGRRGMLSISTEALLPYLNHAMSSRTPLTETSSSAITSNQNHAMNSSGQILIGLDMHSVSDDNKAFYSGNPIYSHVLRPQRDQELSAATVSTPKTAIERLALGNLQMTENFDDLITNALREKIALLVAIDYENIIPTTPIANFGLDSLIAIELKNWITKMLHAPMQTSDILDSPSIIALTNLIMQRIEPTVLREKTMQHVTQILTPTEVLVKGNVDRSPAPKDATIPRLPLQPLEKTLETFYDAVMMFGSEEELLGTRNSIAKLTKPGSIGHRLHSRLTRLAHDEYTECWLADIYNKTFWLQRRAPLRPAMNFFSTHTLIERRCSQAEKASLLSLAAFDFKRKLDRKEIPQDSANDEPQCMESLRWIFNACRRPGIGCDNTLRFPSNDYIVASRNGHIYKIPLLPDGQVIPQANLTAIFERILHIAPREIQWTSMLTADERNRWAEYYSAAEKASSLNRDYFSVIEKSLFMIYLDDGTPGSSEERIKSFLLDDNRNRWNDKTLSFIVCENGVSAFWCEHSMIDGTTIDQLSKAITQAIREDVDTKPQEAVEVLEGRDFTYHPFESSPAIEERIEAVRRQYHESIKDVDFAALELPLGENYFRDHKLMPKGVIQAIVSLAVRQHFGHSPASYEAVSLRSFRLGRMDIYQVYTPEMEAFISAALSPQPSTGLLALIKLLQTAVQTYAAGIAHTSRGRGWDRQLTALRCVLEDGESEPELFRDPVFLRTRPRKVFVSFSATGMPEWGSVWRDREALWIGIEVLGDR